MLDKDIFEDISAYNLYQECKKWKRIKTEEGNICSFETEEGEKEILYIGIYYDLFEFLVMLDVNYDNYSFNYFKATILDKIIEEVNRKTDISIIDVVYMPISMRITVMVKV